MAKLRDADTALQQAMAKVQGSIAAMNEAQAKVTEETARMQKIENDLKEELNKSKVAKDQAELEKALEQIKRDMEKAELEHQKDMDQLAKELEEQQLTMEQNLRDLRMQAKDLSETEKRVLVSSAAVWVAAQQAFAYQQLVVLEKKHDLAEAEAEYKYAVKEDITFATEAEKNAKIDELNEEKTAFQSELEKLGELKVELDEVLMEKQYNEILFWEGRIAEHETNLENFRVAEERYVASVAHYYAETAFDAINKLEKNINDFLTLYPAEPTKDAKEEVVEEFEDALKEFVGTHTNDKGEEVLNIEYKNLANWLPQPEKTLQGNDTEDIVAYMKELADLFYNKTPLGVYETEVNLKGGRLFNNARNYFYDSKYRDLVGTLERWKGMDKADAIAKETILLEGAKKAAVVAAQAHEFVAEFGDEITIDSKEYEDWTDLVADYNAARESYNKGIDDCEVEINNQITEIEAQIDAINGGSTAFYYEYKLAAAIANVDNAEKRLDYLETAVARAESLYRKVKTEIFDNFEGVIDFTKIFKDKALMDAIESLKKIMGGEFNFDSLYKMLADMGYFPDTI